MGRGVGNDITCKAPAAQQLRRKRADKRRPKKGSKGAPLITPDSLGAADRLTAIPENIAVTMAPTGRWIEYAQRLTLDPTRVILNKSRAARLARYVAKMAKGWHGGDGPNVLSGTAAEHMLAEAIEPPARSKAQILKLNFKDKNTPKPRGRGRANEKAYYDVIYKHDDESRNVAWEVKVLNNREQRDDAVLMAIHASDIDFTPKLEAREVAERIFGVIREKQEAAMEQFGVSDSRAIFFWGEGRGKKMLIWQEPYYPGEIDLDEFDWVAKEGSICGYRDGQLVWSWYPRGGNVKHKVHVPDGMAASVRLPKESFTLEEHLKRMSMPLPA